MKKVLKVVLFFLTWSLIGGTIGVTIAYLGDKMELPSLSGWQGFLLFSSAACLAFVICLIIHEAGHVVAGLLTGYKFLSYRIFNLHWQKVDGKIQLKRFSLAGTLGQALMIPPQPQNGKIPYLLYNLGGGLANLLTVPLSMSLIFVFPRGLISWMFLAGFSLIIGLFNLIPMGSHVPNDGYNIYAIKKHPQGSLYFYKMLKVHSDMAQGVTFQEMDENNFVAPTENLNNPMVISQVFPYISRQTALGHYEEARAYLRSLDLEKQKLPQIYAIFSKVTLGYLDLLCDQTTSVSFDKNEQKLFDALSKSQPAFLLYLYAYHGLVTGDEAKSWKARADFAALEKTYPFTVEYEDEKSRLGVFEKFIAERTANHEETANHLH